MTTLIEYRDVRVDGDDGPIVAGFSAVVPAGGLTVVVGPSGAGKTTLLRLLNRLDDPDGGGVLLGGRDVRSYDVLDLRRRVQVVGQVPVTFPGTVAANIAEALDGDGKAAALAEGCSALLSRVGLDPSLVGREADRLSVGEAQRLCLARALALDPEVLALDEPTSALDSASKAGIEELITGLAAAGLTVVMVTHDPRHAELADHVVRLEPHRPGRSSWSSAAASARTGLGGPVGFSDVALALLLVAVALMVSRWRRVGLESDMTVATVRSFVQLLLVGYALDFVFRGHGGYTVVVLAVMIATATWTSGGRAAGVPGARPIAAASISVAAAGTLGALLTLRIIDGSSRVVIPLGSMIISSAMTTTSLVMSRLHDDLAGNRREVEARLALALPSRRAAQPWLRVALRTGMLPTIDQTKVVGLVSLPGAMTGMILAGASPLAAIRLQLVVMYMLLGGNAFAALVSGELTLRRLFTPDHQLIRTLRRTT